MDRSSKQIDSSSKKINNSESGQEGDYEESDASSARAYGSVS